MVRLHKYLAECGVASRRASESLISEGRVSVNGKRVTKQGTSIDPEKDKVTVNGRSVAVDRKFYVVVNKPKGYICTSRDPHGRRTVFDLLKKGPRKAPDARLFTVGRLDYDSEGLLILTNDGELANLLTHPRHHIRKTYLVWIKGKLTSEHVREMKSGIRDEGELLRLKSICLHDSEGDLSCYEVVLGEGRKRQIRRMFKALGFGVQRLQRIRIGPLELGSLKKGAWRMLRPDEVETLKRT